MADFVLVHAAWHGGWCYKKVAAILRAAGHNVFTPTLTGLGERSHLRANVDLDTHITDVLNVIAWEGLSDLVLCGHSYGGIVATGVADAIPEKLTAIVYLDAFLPEDGDSTMSFLGRDRQAAMLLEAQENGGVVSAPAPEFYGVNPRDIEWVRGKLTSQPIATMQQPIRLTGRYRTVKRTYVYAEGEVISAPFYEMCLRDSAWTVHVTNQGGHDQMVDAPEAVADILMQSAAKAQSERS